MDGGLRLRLRDRIEGMVELLTHMGILTHSADIARAENMLLRPMNTSCNGIIALIIVADHCSGVFTA